MATRSQVKAIVEAALMASGRGFWPRGTAGLDTVHFHNDTLIDGLFGAIEEWSIISFYDPSTGLPVDPEMGDAYIASATSNGWTVNYIYEWNGTTWTGTAPRAGMLLWVTSESKFYYFNGSGWVDLSAGLEWQYGWRVITSPTDWILQKFNYTLEKWEDTKLKVKIL